MFDRTHKWSHLGPESSLQQVLKLWIQLLQIDIGLCKFSISCISVGNLCRLRICPFHPSCRIYWHRVVHALSLLMCVGSILWWCPLFLMLAMCVCGFFLFFLISLARVLSILSIFSKNQHLIFLYCFLFFISALFPSIKIYFFQLYKIETLFYAFLFFKCEV